MHKKDTPTRRKGSSKSPSPAHSLKTAEQDRTLARLLVGLYRSTQTPEFFKHLLFQVFWDLAQHYDIQLPNNFTRTWLPHWQTIIARLRAQPTFVTSLRYTFQPTPEEEAALDAEEKREQEVEALFNYLHDKRLPPRVLDDFSDSMTELLQSVHPLNSFAVFRVAFPLALEIAAEEQKEGEQAEGAQ